MLMLFFIVLRVMVVIFIVSFSWVWGMRCVSDGIWKRI